MFEAKRFFRGLQYRNENVITGLDANAPACGVLMLDMVVRPGDKVEWSEVSSVLVNSVGGMRGRRSWFQQHEESGAKNLVSSSSKAAHVAHAIPTQGIIVHE